MVPTELSPVLCVLFIRSSRRHSCQACQLSNATFSTGKQRKADCVSTALYVAVPLPSAVSVWLTSELCALWTRINAQGHRPYSSCMHERCVALHQLAYAQWYRTFLGQSKHAFKGSAYLRSKTRSHYHSSYQSPGNMSIEQPGLAFKQETSYKIKKCHKGRATCK